MAGMSPMPQPPQPNMVPLVATVRGYDETGIRPNIRDANSAPEKGKYLPVTVP